MNPEENIVIENPDDGNWEKHSKKHWSRMLMNHKLDYYPKLNKFQYRGRNYSNNVMEFIKTNGRSHSRF